MSGDGLDFGPVEITPEVQLGVPGWGDYQSGWDSMFSSTGSTNDPLPETGGSTIDWNHLISTVGQTFASTYNAVNHPASPSAYSAPQGQMPTSYSGEQSGVAPAPSGFSMNSLVDFHTPYPYIAIGVVLLLVVAMKKK